MDFSFSRYLSWSCVFTGSLGLVLFCTSYATHEFCHATFNTTNGSCMEQSVGLWEACVYPCGMSTRHASCYSITPKDNEDFIRVSQVFESVGLVSAILATVMAVSSLILKEMIRLKISLPCFIIAGLFALVGSYVFVLGFRDHVHLKPDENDVKCILDQNVQWSFFVNVASGVLCLLTALLNGTIWCRSINYGYRRIPESDH